MLTIPGQSLKLCDGIPRRSFLQIGGLALGGLMGGGGLSLPQLLRAEALAGNSGSRKSVIMIFLSGGPPHQDSFDLKPEAPAEIRGEFQPISTNVPGIEICELFPQLARMADRLSIIRSLVGSDGRHAAFQCLTGHTFNRQPPGGWPAFGSVISKLKGPAEPGVPPFVSLSPKMKLPTWADPGQPGFAGQAHAPFAPNAGKVSLQLEGISRPHLGSRRSLLVQLDRMKKEVETNGALEGADKYYEQAFGILTSSRLAEALDLEREDPRVRDFYGRGTNVPAGFGDAGPLMNDYLLTARRLVEAGVRVVSLAYGRWDWHGRPHGTNFENARDHFPVLDQGLAALLTDLRERGLERDVSVVVWGEFGRSPRINANGGRDHWPQVSCGLVAGGGMRVGQVIGSTNKFGEYAKDRPVHFQEVFATLYRNLGIDTNEVTLNDMTGRPQFLLDHGVYHPIRELA
jgi:hypothetical protein